MVDDVRLATAQANGNSPAVEISRFAHLTESHIRTLFVNGTFGGATVKYQISHNNSDWFDVANADAITAAKVINVEHRAQYHRINVAGGTGVSIDAWVI